MRTTEQNKDVITDISPVRILAIRWYFGTIATVLLVTLILQCILTYSEGRSLANTFSFFTIQSNVLVLVTSAMLALYPSTLKGGWWRALRLAALVGITVTGIVYIGILAKYVHLSGIAAVYNAVFHYIMPTAAVLGFIFLEQKHSFKWRDYLFVAWPVLWLAYTMIRGAYFNPQFTGFSTAPSNYPYPFLDVTKTPMDEVIGSIVFVCLLIVAVGAVYIYADRKKPFAFFRKRHAS